MSYPSGVFLFIPAYVLLLRPWLPRDRWHDKSVGDRLLASRLANLNGRRRSR